MERHGGDRNRRIKQGSRGQKEVEEGIWETAKTKGHFRAHMETYYCRNVLQYKHIWKNSKWNHQITEESKPQLDISQQQCQECQERVTSSWIIGQRGPWKHSNIPSCWQSILIALHKPMVRPYCWGQHLCYQIQKLSWCLGRSFTLTD